MKQYFVYIMRNSRHTVLYVGVTNNLVRRVLEHKASLVPGFTSTYGCTDLVYFEDTPSIKAAIDREKQIKHWRRSKKFALIRLLNPEVRDLSAAVEMTDPS